jgi:hypothetical protein
MTAVQPEYPYPWQFTEIIKTIETSANQMQPFTYQSTAYRHIERKQSAAIGIWKSRQKQHVIKEVKIHIRTAPHQRPQQVIEKVESKHKIQQFTQEEHDRL